MANQTFNSQKFKLVLLKHRCFSLNDLEKEAYSFVTKDRKLFINLGEGYAIRRPKKLENIKHIRENNILQIKDLYDKIIRAKNQKGHIICKLDHNDDCLKPVKLIKK